MTRHDVGMRPEWIVQMRAAAEEFGVPVFGLLGPKDAHGVVNGFGGRPCNQMTLQYRTPYWQVEVTTATRPLGGTGNLVRRLIMSAIPEKLHLPWGVSLHERLVMIHVDDTPTQFRVVEADTGHWVAAGGMKKRHLLLTGTAGVNIEDLALGPVALNLDS